MSTVLVENLEKQAKEYQKENPNFSNTVDSLAKVIREGILNEQLIAYFSEVLSDRTNDIAEIQILNEQNLLLRNLRRSVCEVEFDISEPKNKDRTQADIETRAKILRMFGINKAVTLDRTALGRLNGIISDDLPKDKIDSVELVKSIRGDWTD